MAMLAATTIRLAHRERRERDVRFVPIGRQLWRAVFIETAASATLAAGLGLAASAIGIWAARN